MIPLIAVRVNQSVGRLGPASMPKKIRGWRSPSPACRWQFGDHQRFRLAGCGSIDAVNADMRYRHQIEEHLPFADAVAGWMRYPDRTDRGRHRQREIGLDIPVPTAGIWRRGRSSHTQ